MDIFSPVGATVNLAATTTTGNVALTAIHETGIGSKSVRLYNAGAVAVFVAFGTSAIAAVLATSIPIPPGGVEVFEVSPAVTHVAGITASGTATIYATAGRGG